MEGLTAFSATHVRTSGSDKGLPCCWEKAARYGSVPHLAGPFGRILGGRNKATSTPRGWKPADLQLFENAMASPIEKKILQDNHIAILLPPDGRWLPFLNEGLERYARTVGFSKVLENKISYAVMEAREELIQQNRPVPLPVAAMLFV